MTLPPEIPYVDITEPRREEKILPMDDAPFDNRAGLIICIIAALVSVTCLVVGGLGLAGRL